MEAAVTPDTRTDVRATPASSLAQIIADDEIVAFFQPVVDLDSREIVAYEALARGPAGPLAFPDDLFGAARQEGLLAELDGACRAAAFRGAAAKGLLDPLTLFVNVEPEVLASAPLADLLRLADAAPPGLQVVLEITERALAARPADLLRTVGRVRDLGWRVALDDVGANPASLTFMSLLLPDIVKLDLRLIQDRPSRAVAEIMNAVNAHAERTEALLLAEGIETVQHLDAALALGATLGQGWLFGRPTADPTARTGGSSLALPPAAPPTTDGRPPSPFGCLPAGTRLRRSAKRLLIEISHALEREAAALGGTCIVASTFQHGRHFTPDTARRYRELAARTGFVCALGEDLPIEPVAGVRGGALAESDPVRGEWDVVVLSPHVSAALVARDLGDDGPEADRRFEYALTYRRETVVRAAQALLARVAPEQPR